MCGCVERYLNETSWLGCWNQTLLYVTMVTLLMLVILLLLLLLLLLVSILLLMSFLLIMIFPCYYFIFLCFRSVTNVVFFSLFLHYSDTRVQVRFPLSPGAFLQPETSHVPAAALLLVARFPLRSHSPGIPIRISAAVI